MKRIKIVVLSLCALAFSCPLGFRTSNAKSQSAADKAEDAALGKTPEDETLEQTVERLQGEVQALRAVAPVPPPPPIAVGATELLMKGAGVEAKDVNWRIRAGLTAAQAVEVALAEKVEAERVAKEEGKKK